MTAEQTIGHHGDTKKDVKVKVYDFKRPDKFSKDQVRVMHMMHESFARLTTTSLSARLRTLVHIHVASVDQLTYEEFMRSIPNPCTIARVGMSPLRGEALLEIDPAVTSAIADRALGGEGAGSDTGRDQTPIEETVLQGALTPVVGNLAESWSTVVDLKPELRDLETNPRFCQIVPPTEMVVLVSLEVKLFDATGMMNLCIPFLTLQSILHRLSQRFYYRSVHQPGGAGPSPAGLSVAAEVCCEAGELSLHDLGALRAGTEVPLRAYDRGEIILRAGGVDVVPLRRSGRGRSRDELAACAPVADDQRWIEQPRAAQVSAVEEIQRALSVPLERLQEGLQRSVEELGGRISSVSDRQDQLADQLLLSPPDEQSHLEPPTARPFSFISAEHAETLFGVLQGENPQAVALILSFLDTAVVSQVLSSFDPEDQIEIVRRIARLQHTAPEVLSRVEDVVRTRFAQVGAASLLSGGGLDMAAEVLSTAARSVERTVLEALDQSDPELAEELKRRMLVFEDIVLLDASAVGEVCSKADTRDIAVALKGTSERVASHILDSLGEELRGEVTAVHEELGAVRLRNVEEAQQRIVSLIRELEETGVVVVARPEEVVE